MTSGTQSPRFMMLIAAFFATIGAMAFDAGQANAQCCNVNIRNATQCRFEACIVTANGRRCTVILPGGNNFDVPECPNYRFYAIDSCGVPHAFPTQPNTFVNIITPGGCCVRIYLSADCCWEVAYADACPPCY